MSASRFAKPISEQELTDLRKSAIPSNTKMTTEWGVRLWNEWATSRVGKKSDKPEILPLSTPLLELPTSDLAHWLAKFVLEVRKKNGSEYPPKSLYALVCCFKRYFETNKIHNVNPLNPSDSAFGEFRSVIDAEMRRLHRNSLGTSSRQAEPITPDEEAILWTTGQFGTHNGQALLNTVYYYNCKVFGLRSYDEHKNLACSQYTKKVDEQGRVYLEYTDYGNKTNRGGLSNLKLQAKCIRQYENSDDEEHCVVNIFVTYFSFIPSRDGPFYYRALPNPAKGVPRYSNQLVGKNTLSQIIPNICKAAGIEGRKTGHSGKVTCATTLYRNNFTDQHIY